MQWKRLELIGFGTVGALCAYQNWGFLTWQFWVLILLNCLAIYSMHFLNDFWESTERRLRALREPTEPNHILVDNVYTSKIQLRNDMEIIL